MTPYEHADTETARAIVILAGEIAMQTADAKGVKMTAVSVIARDLVDIYKQTLTKLTEVGR